MPETIPSMAVPALLMSIFVFLAILTTWIVVVLRLAFGLPVLPPRTPRYVPWGAGSVALAILVWLGLQIAVPIAYIETTRPRMPGFPTPRTDLTSVEQMTLSAAINALVLIVIPAGLAITSGARRRDFGIVAEGFWRQVFRGVVTYPLIAPLVFGVMIGSLLIWNKTPHPLENALKIGHNPAMVTILVLAGVVFAPLAEELIFRGVLLGWLTRLALRRPKPEAVITFLDDPEFPTQPEFTPIPSFADELDRDPHNPYAPPLSKIEAPVVISPTTSGSQIALLILSNVVVSLIFASLHAPVWPTPIPIFFLSLGLGVLYQRTGSLIPSMALHMTFNGVSTFLMLLTLGNPAPKTKDEAKPPVAPNLEAKAVGILDLSGIIKRAH
jgi:membrane protease YdiL (CAAX protease family)